MKTSNVERHKAVDYLKRAQECFNACQLSLEKGEWNACVINAIHCAISAADAFCIHKKGVRHAGDRHAEAIQLLLSINPQDEELKRVANKLSRLLDIKTDSEYGERLSTAKDAKEAHYNAFQILEFVKTRVRKTTA